ncbi:rubrerythrin-like domain-containing protein [Natronoarchaeum rubrum]|nr:rubrerythrin-like domain-containing protein [Natronoarchaeum rubrum]
MRGDPYTPVRPTYECTRCEMRTTTDTSGVCPRCGAQTINIAVARE